MRRLPSTLYEILDPRKVLLAALLVAAGGLFLTYAEVQNQADRELALRQGPPAPVLIQDFDPESDIAAAGEVRMFGEIDMSAAVTLPVRHSDPQAWVRLVPVFPVSDIGAALLAEREGKDAGVLKAQVERRVVAGVPNLSAAGVIVIPISGPDAVPQDAAEIAEEIIGEGHFGALALLDGEGRDPREVELVAHGALAVMNISLADRFVSVVPYLQGREAALSAPLAAAGQYLVFVAALILVAMAAAAQVWRAMVPAAGFGDDDEDMSEASPAPRKNHPNFAPIPSQREIRSADREAAKIAAGPNPLVTGLKILGQGLWAMLWLAGRALSSLTGRAVRALRNRRSRPEDEAL